MKKIPKKNRMLKFILKLKIMLKTYLLTCLILISLKMPINGNEITGLKDIKDSERKIVLICSAENNDFLKEKNNKKPSILSTKLSLATKSNSFRPDEIIKSFLKEPVRSVR